MTLFYKTSKFNDFFVLVAKNKDNIIYALYLSDDKEKLISEFQKEFPNFNLIEDNSLVIDKILDYLDNPPSQIDLPYHQNLTPFQEKVFEIIKSIPIGKTLTYSEIASLIHKPKSQRAIAKACSKNNIGLIIPCHRVVGKNNIGGYSWGVNIKKYLLDKEQKYL